MIESAPCPDGLMEMCRLPDPGWSARISAHCWAGWSVEVQVERSVPTFWRDTYNDRNDTAVRRVWPSHLSTISTTLD